VLRQPSNDESKTKAGTNLNGDSRTPTRLGCSKIQPAGWIVFEWGNCAPTRRPPNVPPLSSGRISKRGGIRWRRASPWYLTTGDRQTLHVATRRGRLLQRLVGQRPPTRCHEECGGSAFVMPGRGRVVGHRRRRRQALESSCVPREE
jgi:hypothetical protein